MTTKCLCCNTATENELCQECEAVLLADKGEDSSCQECFRQAGPSHDGSEHCESDSIASGGTRSHCSCDYCF